MSPLSRMPNTYLQIYVQVVFASEGRQSLIAKERYEELHKYITGIVTERKQKLLAVHCMPDHTQNRPRKARKPARRAQFPAGKRQNPPRKRPPKARKYRFPARKRQNPTRKRQFRGRKRKIRWRKRRFRAGKS